MRGAFTSCQNIDNFQVVEVDNTFTICEFLGPSSTSSLFLEDVILQNYSLMEKVTPDYAVTGWHSQSSTGNIENEADC
jgi:hypothetical protein